MATEVRTFRSISELIKWIDGQMTNMRRELSELLRILEDLRVKAEQARRLKELLAKLGAGAPSQSTVINLGEVKLAVNPDVETELSIYEEVAENLNRKIAKLQQIRRNLETLGNIDVEVQLKVIIVDDIPRAILMKI